MNLRGPVRPVTAAAVYSDLRAAQQYVVELQPAGPENGHDGDVERFSVRGSLFHARGQTRELCAEYSVEVGAMRCATGQRPAGALADLLDIAQVVHHVDKLAPTSSPLPPRSAAGVRRQACPGRRVQSRRICAQIPVRNPALWAAPHVRECLHALLDYLTYDTWHLEFVDRPEYGSTRSQLAAVPLPGLPPDSGSPDPTVCLFSGGLDAFAGVAELLRQSGGARDEGTSGSAGSLILVSAETNRSIGAVQRALVDGLRLRYPHAQFRHVTVPVLLEGRSDSGEDGRSARTRGFLFLAIGLATAVLVDAPRLFVFENGVGALNLPYTRGQSGPDTSRSVHPSTLVHVQQLVRLILAPAQVPTVVNPFLFTTKGQMCRTLRPAGLEHLVPFTVSCDAFPKHVAGPRHCGACTSCLLRRNSLWAAGLDQEDARTRYRWDVTGVHRPTPTDRSSVQLDLFPKPSDGAAVELSPRPRSGAADARRGPASRAHTSLRAMEEQVVALRSSLEGDPDSGERLLRAFPALPDVCDHMATASSKASEAIASGFMRLFSTHVTEWNELASRLPAHGAGSGVSKTGVHRAATGHDASALAQRTSGELA